MKFKPPKIKVKVKSFIVLWAIFALVIVTESFVLYKYAYLSVQQSLEEIVQTQDFSIRIDLKVYQNAIDRVAANQGYKIVPYSLTQGAVGRDNPFAEYR